MKMKSEWQSPTPPILMRTSPASGSGTGTSRNSGGCCQPVSWKACMVATALPMPSASDAGAGSPGGGQGKDTTEGSAQAKDGSSRTRGSRTKTPDRYAGDVSTWASGMALESAVPLTCRLPPEEFRLWRKLYVWIERKNRPRAFRVAQAAQVGAGRTRRVNIYQPKSTYFVLANVS